jgi:hypothetical protein
MGMSMYEYETVPTDIYLGVKYMHTGVFVKIPLLVEVSAINYSIDMRVAKYTLCDV